MRRQQLLIRAEEHSRGHVEVVDNDAGASPATFEHPEIGIEVPVLGTESLLRLASGLSKFGYALIAVEIRRGNGAPASHADELGETIVDLINGGFVDQALGVLESSFHGGSSLAVVKIRISKTNSPLQFELDRNGVVTAHPDVSAERFPPLASTLNSVWPWRT